MKIKSVKAHWVHIPIPHDRQHVSDFGRTLSFDGTLVRIDTECGLTGWGEAKAQVGGMAQNQALTLMINEEFAPLLKGEDPRDITRLWETLYNGTRAHYALREGRVFPVLGRRGIAVSAISGVDCALWDILGKSLGVPVWRLLGGRRSEKMPAYASGGWAGPDKIGEELLGYIAHGGFGAVKMGSAIIEGAPRHSARRVHAAREALGPEVGLMCDAHGTLSVAEAKRFCRLVEDCNLAWFEEPVTADDKRGQAEVRAMTDIPIASGESEFTRHDFRDLATLGAVDIMQPDLAICGGITEAMRISALASAHNLKLAPHLWAGAPAFAAGLHVAAASPAGFIVEYSLGANPLLHDLVEESFPVGGVTICNAYGHETAIAEYVLMSMLVWRHRFREIEGDFRLRSSWAPSWVHSGAPHGEIRGSTLGIVGLGRVGREAARRAAAFGCRILAANRSPREPGDGVERVYLLSQLDDMLPQCDTVAICTAFGPETEGLIDERRLGVMKPSALLVNIAGCASGAAHPRQDDRKARPDGSRRADRYAAADPCAGRGRDPGRTYLAIRFPGGASAKAAASSDSRDRHDRPTVATVRHRAVQRVRARAGDRRVCVCDDAGSERSAIRHGGGVPRWVMGGAPACRRYATLRDLWQDHRRRRLSEDRPPVR